MVSQADARQALQDRIRSEDEYIRGLDTLAEGLRKTEEALSTIRHTVADMDLRVELKNRLMARLAHIESGLLQASVWLKTEADEQSEVH